MLSLCYIFAHLIRKFPFSLTTVFYSSAVSCTTKIWGDSKKRDNNKTRLQTFSMKNDSLIEIDWVGTLHPLVEQDLHLSYTRTIFMTARLCNQRNASQFGKRFVVRVKFRSNAQVNRCHKRRHERLIFKKAENKI